ncbi:alpha/beta hydrolase [Nocardia sp. NPDC019395]|uniref:alpha/beta fold hydrolase n=1 Tax=Nocardia sp. NPDC019395 TaxID=3154686 RepID=UPI0033C55C48
MHTQGAAEWIETRDGRELYAQVLDGPFGNRGEEGSTDAAGTRGAVTVVFEAGYAAQRSTWAPVQTRVAEFARAVVYDRSGLGRSAPDPGGRSLERMAADLNDVLDHLGTGPFVLVGHSAGGPIVRAAAANPQRRQEVIGLVLVDPSDEAAGFAMSRTTRLLEQVIEPIELGLAKLGLFKPLFGKLLAAMPAEDVRADLDREAFTPQVVRTQIQQTKTFIPELRAWRQNAPDLGDIPVTVVSGALPGDGMIRKQRTAFVAAHATRAAASARGRHVMAPNSAHYVPLTDADLVAAEVRRLAEA